MTSVKVRNGLYSILAFISPQDGAYLASRTRIYLSEFEIRSHSTPPPPAGQARSPTQTPNIMAQSERTVLYSCLKTRPGSAAFSCTETQAEIESKRWQRG